MRKQNLYLLSLSVVASLALSVFAQAPAASPAPAPAAAPAMPAAEDILTRIPADCLGFVAVRNVGDFGAKVDKFLTDIDMAKMLPGSVLPLIKGGLKLDAGFNDNGGAALVFLDPAQFGMTVEDFSGATPPIVFILPGNNPKAVLANWEPAEEAGYVTVTLPSGDQAFAKPLGGYTVLGQTKQMVDAVVASTKPVASKMSPDHRDVFAKADLAGYADMKTLAPLLGKFIDEFQEKMTQEMSGEFTPPPAKAMMSIYGSMLPFYKDMFGQMEGVTIGLRLGKAGVSIDEVATYKPDSDLGKMMLAAKAPTGPLLDKLPSLPYVLAIGGSGESDAAAKKFGMDMIGKLLANEIFAKVPEATKTKLRDTCSAWCDQVQGMQFYGGGATPGKGVFGVSVVLRVKDAAVVTGLVNDGVQAGMDMLKALLEDQEDAKGLAITYNKAAVTAAGTPVDVIEITHPNLATMSDSDKQEMAKVLGDDKIRVFVAQADPKTVVVSFGGGEAFLAEALKAAREGGAIAKDPDVAAAMKELPANPMAVVLFSPANLVQVIKAGVAIMNGPEALQQQPWPMIDFQSKAPIAIGVAARGAGIHESIFLPTPAIAETVKLIMGLMFQPMRGPGGPGAPGAPGRPGGAPATDF
jgi:hypothetical protein